MPSMFYDFYLKEEVLLSLLTFGFISWFGCYLGFRFLVLLVSWEDNVVSSITVSNEIRKKIAITIDTVFNLVFDRF